MKKNIALLSFFILTSALPALRENWKPMPGTKINFTIDGMFGIDVNGTISNLRSTIEFYPEDLGNSSIQASIEPSTLDSKNKKRDKHLKTADFFEVEKYTKISFVSKSFRKVGEYFVVEGNLTLKDVTKPITIPFEFTNTGDSAVFNGDFTINRLDYHVGKKSMMMGDEVRVHLSIPVTQTK